MAVKSTQQLKQDLDSIIYENHSREVKAKLVNKFLHDVIDSTFNQISQAANVGLKDHDSSVTYKQGQTVLKFHAVWKANKQTTGTFSEADWDLVTGLRSRVVSSNYTIDQKSDRFIFVDTAAAGADVDITLPATSDAWSEDRMITVVNIGGANKVRIFPDGTDQVDGGNVLELHEDKGRADLAKTSAGNFTSTQLPDLPSFLVDLVSELADLTSSEVEQLKNIDTVTVSNFQWGVLGAVDQQLHTSANVQFLTLETTRYSRTVERQGRWHQIEEFGSDINDYNPQTFYIQALPETTGLSLTGVIRDGRVGTELVIVNISGTDFTIPHESTQSNALNRFLNNNAGNDLVLSPDGMAVYRYDEDDAGRWRLQSRNADTSFV